VNPAFWLLTVMLDVDLIMRGPRLKVERAQGHIQSLIDLSSPLSKDLYKVRITLAHSVAILAKPNRIHLVYEPIRPIAETFALIIGDAVHNLRSSLDHWAAAVVSDITGKPRDTRVYFPFWGKGQDPKSARGYAPIEKALPQAAVFARDQIKPCEDGNGDLYAVTNLDNIDKHNFILPTVTVVSIKDINLETGIPPGGVIKTNDCTVNGDATRKIVIASSYSPIHIQDNFKTSVEITFPKGSLFEDQPVIPTLLNLCQVVSKTLSSLERFLTNPRLNRVMESPACRGIIGLNRTFRPGLVVTARRATRQLGQKLGQSRFP
jgi:hypothetical protein